MWSKWRPEKHSGRGTCPPLAALGSPESTVMGIPGKLTGGWKAHGQATSIVPTDVVPADIESNSRHVSEVTPDHQTPTEPIQTRREDSPNWFTELTAQTAGVIIIQNMVSDMCNDPTVCATHLGNIRDGRPRSHWPDRKLSTCRNRTHATRTRSHSLPRLSLNVCDSQPCAEHSSMSCLFFLIHSLVMCGFTPKTLKRRGWHLCHSRVHSSVRKNGQLSWTSTISKR